MKTLYLLRHAKSCWKLSDRGDFDRPLNPRGENDAPLMGKQLAEKHVHPDLIISSPAERAVSTVSFVAKEIDYDYNEILFLEKMYLASLDELLHIIHNNVDPAIEKLLMVGHNYGLTDLANYLSPNYIDNIPTTGIVSLSFSCMTWREIGKKKSHLNFFDYPKNYK